MDRVRVEKLDPWYHALRPRCITLTLQKTRCTFSASWVDTATERIKVCKTHKDMMPDVQFRRLTARMIVLEDQYVPGTPAIRGVASAKFSG